MAVKTGKTVIAFYSGYRPRVMRTSKSRHESERSGKRSRLGNRQDRALYKSCKGHKTNPARYMQLCITSNRLIYGSDHAGREA